MRMLGFLGLVVLMIAAAGCTAIEGIAPAPSANHFYVCENSYVMGMSFGSIVEYKIDGDGKFVFVRVVR